METCREVEEKFEKKQLVRIGGYEQLAEKIDLCELCPMDERCEEEWSECRTSHLVWHVMKDFG